MNTLNATSDMVRRVNRERIRDALRHLREASVADLARATGLSVATCAKLLPEMVEAGEALEIAPESQGGRPARRFGYNPDYALVAVLILFTDGGEAEVRYSVRNGDCRELHRGVKAFAALGLSDVEGIVKTLCRKYPAIKAAALSVPGILRDGFIESCDINELSGLNPEKHLAETTGLAIVSENDMNFAALGYCKSQPFPDQFSLAYMMFLKNEPPGMGLVVNGALIKGKSNFAGEIKFLPTASPKTSARFMATACASVTAVLNPETVVLTGAAVTPDTLDAVRAHCLRWIPEKHMPTLVYRPDCGEDAAIGMTETALANLSYGVKFVRKDHLQI